MSDPIRDDPAFQAFEADVLENLVPSLRGSAVAIALTPRGEPDVKFAVELGMMIMLDKPIVVVTTPGQEIPARLRRIADEVIEIDWNAPRSDQLKAVQDGISQMLVNLGATEED